MALTTAEEKTLLQSFARLGQVWGVARKGYIATVNGAVVGTWAWNTTKMILNPTDKDFTKAVRGLQKSGILHRVPVSGPTEQDLNAEAVSDTSRLEAMPLNQANPGILDYALKQLGYLVIDSNLPVANGGE